MTDAASTRSNPDKSSATLSRTLLYAPRPRFSRAANYLMRYGAEQRNTGMIIETEKFGTSIKSSSCNAVYTSDYARIVDMFATKLNRCSSPEEIARLRYERAVENPIICYESDDDYDKANRRSTQDDEGSREGKPSVFVDQCEGTHHHQGNQRDVIFQGRSSCLPELPMISTCMKFRCYASPAHYLPKSAHIVAPQHFPQQQLH